jgi:serine protease AprX
MISPNPANDFADVLVSLSDPQKVQLNVYDVMGKQVISTSYGQQSSGYHKYQVITSELTSGVYLFTVKIGNSQTSRKVVVN